MNVPAAASESQGIAIFGAKDDTLHYRIEAKNILTITDSHLTLEMSPCYQSICLVFVQKRTSNVLLTWLRYQC
jgi:hypothetical protein